MKGKAPTPSAKIVDRMRAYYPDPWRWHEATCRFCGEWKRRDVLQYGTRHYACRECVDGIIARAALAAAKEQA